MVRGDQHAGASEQVLEDLSGERVVVSAAKQGGWRPSVSLEEGVAQVAIEWGGAASQGD